MRTTLYYTASKTSPLLFQRYRRITASCVLDSPGLFPLLYYFTSAIALPRTLFKTVAALAKRISRISYRMMPLRATAVIHLFLLPELAALSIGYLFIPLIPAILFYATFYAGP